MLKFNILPKAKLVTEEFLAKKRKLSNNPFVIAYDKLTTSSLIVYTAILAILMGFMAAFLQDIEKIGGFFVALAVILMGLTFVLAGIGKTGEFHGTTSVRSARRIFVIVGLNMIVFTVILTLGPGTDGINLILPYFALALYILFMLKTMIFPWFGYAIKQERLNHCTMSASAHLTDIESGLRCEKTPDLNYLSCYEFIYEYNGNSYMISTYEKHNIVQNEGCMLIISIDPDKPENFYSDLFINHLPLKALFKNWQGHLILAAVFTYLFYNIALR